MYLTGFNHFTLVAFCLWIATLYATTIHRRSQSESQVRTLYEFPNNTWVENLAVRANGDILLSLLTSPNLYTIDPHGINPPTLVYSFPSVLGALGIAEATPDVFAVITGNYTSKGPTQGSFSIWQVNMRGVRLQANGTLSTAPQVTKVTDMPDAKFPNGMGTLSKHDGLVLIGDISAGVIYRLDIHSAQYEVVVANILTSTAYSSYFRADVGVNGLHVHDDNLYVANTGRGTFGRVPIHKDGTPAGEVVVISQTLNSSDYLDDFTIGRHGNAYLVTGGGNSIEEVTSSGKQVIVAGSLNSTVIAEPTSAAFGRGSSDAHVLYVTTAGGIATPVDGTTIIGGQLLAIDL